MLQGKKFLITGVANSHSIAYGIAKALRAWGAELAFTYQYEKYREKITALATELGSSILLPLEASSDESIDRLFTALNTHWQRFDGIVHSIAFAPKHELSGSYTENATRDGFHTAHDMSVFSFVALAKRSLSMLNSQSSLLTISYLGANRVVPHYNVMSLAKASLESAVRVMAYDLGAYGIRVNAISSGPIKTLAASGISDFQKILHLHAQNAPLKRNVTADEIGKVAAFLLSDMASAITGEIIKVDAGFSTVVPSHI